MSLQIQFQARSASPPAPVAWQSAQAGGQAAAAPPGGDFLGLLLGQILDPGPARTDETGVAGGRDEDPGHPDAWQALLAALAQAVPGPTEVPGRGDVPASDVGSVASGGDAVPPDLVGLADPPGGRAARGDDGAQAAGAPPADRRGGPAVAPQTLDAAVGLHDAVELDPPEARGGSGRPPAPARTDTAAAPVPPEANDADRAPVPRAAAGNEGGAAGPPGTTAAAEAAPGSVGADVFEVEANPAEVGAASDQAPETRRARTDAREVGAAAGSASRAEAPGGERPGEPPGEPVGDPPTGSRGGPEPTPTGGAPSDRWTGARSDARGEDRRDEPPAAAIATAGGREAPHPFRMEGAERADVASPARQVAEHVGRMELRAGERREVEIQLSPEHLGRVRLYLALEDGALQARIVASTGESRELLRQDVQQLRQTLLDQGFKQVSVQVALGNSGEQGRWQQPEAWRNRSGVRGRLGLEPVVLSQAAAAGAYGRPGAGRLDLRM